jgi:arabinoxylan arabinofuranohydrolase
VPVTVTAQSRCLGGRAYVAVQAHNDHDGPVRIDIETGYGERSFPAVAPGANAYQSFTTRAASVAAGSVTVRATGTVTGTEVTTVYPAEYPGVACAA